MNRRTLVLLILVVVVALGAGWFALGVVDGERREAAQPGVRGAAETEDARPSAELAGVGGSGQGVEDRSAAGSARLPAEASRSSDAAGRAPAWRADGEQWLEGGVAFPPGTPADERVFVLALDAEMGADALFDGPAVEVWRASPALVSPLLSCAEVAPDGSFRVALPIDAREVHLALSGRYLFTRATRVVALPAAAPVTLTGELGAWVTGMLVDAEGSAGAAPKAFELLEGGAELGLGADISGGFDPARLSDEAWGQESGAGPDGSFEFRAVNPALPHSITLKPERYAPQLLLGVDVQPGQHLELTVPLTQGATLRGRVVDSAAAPLAGVTVEVNVRGLMGQAVGALRAATSNAEGAFELRNVPAGELDLIASLAGYKKTRKPLEQAVFDGETRTDLLLVVDRGATLAGRVSFPDGAPASDADVSASLPGNPFGGMEGMRARRVGAAQTDGAGRFRITGLSKTKHELEANVEVGVGESARTWTAKAKDVAVDGGELELVLQEVVALRGRVVDGEGRAIPAFTVGATQGGGAMFGIGVGYEERTVQDEDGRFAFEGLGPGAWELVVVAQGFGSSDAQEVVMPPAPDAAELLFALVPAAAVEGVVLDPAGAPAPGAKVTLELALADMMKAQRGRGIPEARADQEGRFHLEGVDPGAIDLVATLEGYAASEPVECEALSGRVVGGLVLELREGGTLTGELYDDEGNPDGGKTVIVQKLPSYSSRYLPMTDVDGAFRVEHLEPGRWQVVTSKNFMTGDPDRAADEAMADFMANMKTEFVEIVEGETSHVVLGAPGEDPVRFFGRVLHAGEPVTNVIVMVMPSDAASLASLKMRTTNAAGEFEFTLDRPGEIRVSVQRGNGLGQQDNIEYREMVPEGVPEHELVIDLPVGRISGTVSGPDGKPLAGARITLIAEGGARTGSFLGTRYSDTNAGPDGRYDLPFLPAGVYTVGAGGVAMGGVLGGESTGGRVLKSGLHVTAGEWLDHVDFRLKEPGTLRGRVLDESGAPVADASIFLRDQEGRLLENMSMLTSDFNGRFLVDTLAPGPYTVSARSASAASSDSGQVTIQAGREAEVSVTLSPGTVLVITVVDEGGTDVEANLSVLDSQGREVGAMRSMQELMILLALDPDERKHRIGPLPAGAYSVTATTDDGREARRPVTLDGQKERKIKLRVR